ncbi:hypothetical protein D8Y22_12945 [Salinadaptatus halalkaliphilus]|uniref:Uncharacterized protein n=1 Tax=Salinadaptatus halalkaliphilus TaxID=2419781 RepID=A0A4S3TK90_9EURY|nr:hypothetical protein D8Y22_12945 [Salinadaptatus halalkaliphilus]
MKTRSERSTIVAASTILRLRPSTGNGVVDCDLAVLDDRIDAIRRFEFGGVEFGASSAWSGNCSIGQVGAIEEMQFVSRVARLDPAAATYGPASTSSASP